MKLRLLFSLLGLSMAHGAHAQIGPASSIGLAGQATVSYAPDPELNWRDPQWLSRQRERSRWRYQMGLE